MNETPHSLASARSAANALEEAKLATSPEDRKFHLNQAAIYAHLAEQARRDGEEGD